MENLPLDMKQLFFNNMKLLGFDAHAMEAANHIPFNRTMFELPNRRGAEIVLHFLFQRLNPTMCKEYFRDCWPVLDKKREQAFRKTCYTWLTNIAQEEQESRLPRINASLFMSPGGDKFYQLLFHFSGFVREKVMENELGSKGHEGLRYPSLTSQNLPLGEVMTKDLACSSVRHRRGYFNTAQLTLQANNTWQQTVDEYVKDYRKLSKDIRELDYKIRAEEQKAIEASVARGSPVKRHGQPDHIDPDFDPGTIKRAQRVQQVREMWQQLADFERTESAEREVVESIVERTINKHRLDAADISIKVPDMLLRECGEEIRRRNVDNTYQGGKLNLVSVLQLWNLCLHLYLEKIHQVGVAKFDEDLALLKSQLHVQQSYRQNAVTLRHQMAESIPALKSSIQKLREKLDNVLFQDQSPESIRTTSVGLGLVEPSPQPNFSPGSAVTPAGGVGVTRSPQNVDTPAAADRIAEDVRAAVRKGPEEMFSELNLNLLDQENREERSSLPRPSKSGSQVSSRQSSRPTSARSQASQKPSQPNSARSQTSQKPSRPNSARSQTSQKPSRPTSARSTSSKGSKGSVTPRQTTGQDDGYQYASSPRTLIQSLKLEQSYENKENLSYSSTQPEANLSARSDGSRTLSARSERSTPRSAGSAGSRLSTREAGDGGRGDRGAETKVPGRKTPTDLLVEEIMGEGKILSPFASGMEAFESHDVLRRTPAQDEEWQEEDGGDAREVDNLAGSPYNEDRGGAREVDKLAGSPYDEDGGGAREVDKLAGSPYDEDGGGAREVHVDKLTGSPYDDDGMEEILGPELEEEYDNDNLSGLSHRSSEPLIVINRSLQQSPRSTFPPDSPRGSSLQQSPRGWTLTQSPNDLSLGPSPLIQQIRQAAPDNVVDLPGSPGGSDPMESPREAEQQSVSLGESPNVSQHSSPRQEKLSGEEFTPPDSPHGAIIIDRSFQYTPQHTEFGRPRSQTPVKLPSEEHKPMSPAARLSQSLMSPLSADKTPVAKAMLAQLLSSESRSLDRSLEIRKMFKDAISDTPVNPRRQDRDSAAGGGVIDDLELPNMDPSSRYLSDIDADTGLKPADISWDLTDNIQDIEMPDFGLDDNDDDDNLDADIDAIIGEINEEKDMDTEKAKDGSLLNINSKDLEDFFSEKTPDLPRRTVSKTSETNFEDFGAMQGSPEGLNIDMEEELAKYSLEDEPQLISFTP